MQQRRLSQLHITQNIDQIDSSLNKEQISEIIYWLLDSDYHKEHIQKIINFLYAVYNDIDLDRIDCWRMIAYIEWWAFQVQNFSWYHQFHKLDTTYFKTIKYPCLLWWFKQWDSHPIHVWIAFNEEETLSKHSTAWEITICTTESLSDYYNATPYVVEFIPKKAHTR